MTPTPACRLGSGLACYHAGDKLAEDGSLVTNGGRVMGVTATAPTLREAMAAAYQAAEDIGFEGKYLRRDIGQRALRALEG